MMVLEELKAYLATVTPSLGIIVTGKMPASPDEIVVLSGYGGGESEQGFGTSGIKYEYPGVQVRVRGVAHDFDGPLAIAYRAYNEMAKIQGMTLSSVEHLFCHIKQHPWRIAEDENSRQVYEFNCIIDKEPS